MKKIIKETDINFRGKFSHLLKKRKFDSDKLDKIVMKIIKNVVNESDDALVNYTKKFDKFDVKNFNQLIVSEKEIDSAYKKTDLKTIKGSYTYNLEIINICFKW